ncbi:MAG: polysaccharide biosynthesis/export family protein [Prevotella sp.]|nr:polysaccharide biosynthesis/export family protein [Prevotella sp.]
MRHFRIILWTMVILLAASCKTPSNVTYFQDMENGNEETISHVSGIRLKPDDQISIVVKSRTAEVTNSLNLPIISHLVGSPEEASINRGQGNLGYTIDSEGNIDFPLLGNLHIAGMTRKEVSELIKKELASKQLAADVVVTVDFLNLSYSVMGEVLTPGKYSINKEKVSILEALSTAGDMTLYGNREKVIVQREENGVSKTYTLNLLNGKSLLKSPAYYLQQNDVVYVSPNDYRKRQAYGTSNETKTGSFWISIVSVLTTVAVLIFK